jgi:hypothetical protein
LAGSTSVTALSAPASTGSVRAHPNFPYKECRVGGDSPYTAKWKSTKPVKGEGTRFCFEVKARKTDGRCAKYDLDKIEFDAGRFVDALQH